MVYAQEQKPNHVGNPAAMELHFTRVWLFCHIFLGFIIFYKIGNDVTWDINREKVQSRLHRNFSNNSINRETAFLQKRKGQLINLAYVIISNGNIAVLFIKTINLEIMLPWQVLISGKKWNWSYHGVINRKSFVERKKSKVCVGQKWCWSCILTIIDNLL